eukprot:347541-Hanusia_phi.AAC.1
MAQIRPCYCICGDDGKTEMSKKKGRRQREVKAESTGPPRSSIPSSSLLPPSLLLTPHFLPPSCSSSTLSHSSIRFPPPPEPRLQPQPHITRECLTSKSLGSK